MVHIQQRCHLVDDLSICIRNLNDLSTTEKPVVTGLSMCKWYIHNRYATCWTVYTKNVNFLSTPEQQLCPYQCKGYIYSKDVYLQQRSKLLNGLLQKREWYVCSREVSCLSAYTRHVNHKGTYL